MRRSSPYFSVKNHIFLKDALAWINIHML